MLLLFSEDKIANKIACIVWMNKRAVFITKTPGVSRQIIDFLLIFWLLIGLAYCRLAVHEPILRRLFEIVASHMAISVYNRWFVREVVVQEVLCVEWIFHDKTNAYCVA